MGFFYNTMRCYINDSFSFKNKTSVYISGGKKLNYKQENMIQYTLPLLVKAYILNLFKNINF